MSGSTIRARTPRGEVGSFKRSTDPDEREPFLDDAAHYPGGHCDEVCFPTNEAEVAAVLAGAERVLVVGAQSSLTGGATPQGGTVLSTARMRDVIAWGETSVRVGPGMVLSELERELRRRDLYYPPVPTYDGASVGGTVATNAAGAATFKYGTTRDWVDAITVVLASGDVLDIRRGETLAGDDGRFTIEPVRGHGIVFAIPGYTMPAVRKHSAGYYAKPGMDLIDLFIGAEGTLGVVTEVELRLSAPRPAWFAGFTPVAGDRAAIDLVAELRAESKRTWSGAQSAETGADVAAVEYIDGRCLELLREDGAFAQVGIPCPDDAGAAVIFQAELPAGTTRDAAFEQLGRLDSEGVETPLLRLCRILVDHGVFDRTLPVLPGETGRRDALLRLREAVPAGVNRRIRERQRTIDPTISKAACDVIVPFERFAESLARYRDILGRYELDHAIWGHISDGNVHPNILPADGEQMARAGRALIELGDAAIALGGCPMSEHGVGRSPLKQELLRRLYGDDGVAAMRAVKQALDPEWLLAPGVLFAQPASK